MLRFEWRVIVFASPFYFSQLFGGGVLENEQGRTRWEGSQNVEILSGRNFECPKTYLSSSITEDDESLPILGYDFIRSDRPSNNKRGNVAIYYKNSLPLKLIDVNRLSETTLFELQIGSKICNSISLYQSPSQTADNFDSFLDHLKLNLDAMTDKNPFLVVATGDFNAPSSC